MSSNTAHRLNTLGWNLALISLGSFLFAIGLKAIVIPHKMITGGISGAGLLVFYWTGLLSPGIWYFLINLPIFILGWIMVSRRFFFYSLYGMLVLSAAIDMVSFQFPIQDTFLAMLAGGVILGAGSGVILHSLGSAGGTDIIAIILHQRLNLRMGSFYFAFNLILFASSLSIIRIDLLLYSLAMSFVTSRVLDSVLTLFNQRKLVFIISDQATAIGKAINERLRRGATLLEGVGSYTGKKRRMVLTVVHNIQLKRLEETVFSLDPDAFVIMENTYNVMGKGFSKRKIY